MAPRPPKNVEERRRVVAWLRWFYEGNRQAYPTQRALAKALGITPASVTQILGDDRKVGLDAVIAVSRLTGLPIDTIIAKEPPGSNANVPRPTESPSPSPRASPSRAEPRKRRAGGGRHR